MKVSLIIPLFIFSLSLNDAKNECGFECPDVIWGDCSTTIEEMVLMNLNRPGPSEGICNVGKKFIIDGSFYNMDSKCICMALQGKDIKRGDGKRCPDTILGKPSETFLQLDKRIYQKFRKFAPQDGWCPKGSIKWIIKGSSIGKSKDICKCIHNYEFYEPDRNYKKCSHSSSSS